MMPPYRPPLPPLPPQEWLGVSSEEYMRMKMRHAEMERQRSEDRKWDEAVMLVFAAIMGIICVLMVCFPLYMGLGWRGPVGAFLFVGLVWVAIVQVKQRL